jgi:two-component system, OmpR family, alkaline phosphatase synthesis response regulator PhoP
VNNTPVLGTVLIVDDEISILEIARRYLEHAGFLVLEARDGLTGLNLARTQQPDMIVLDVMLPKLDGWRMLEELRSSSLERRIPVLMLTARGEESDRLRGLESGADDYLLKPFSPRELVARIKNVLRRDQVSDDRLRFGTLEIEFANRRVSNHAEDLKLTPLEFELLVLFARHAGRLWSRAELLERLWGAAFDGVDRVVDVHVSGLRRKLGEAGSRIQTVRGSGYRFLDGEIHSPLEEA